MEELVDIITLPNQLDQSSLGSLIRNLYPASKVPDIVVVKVVGCLGHGRAKLSYAAQASLLKWLIMVYDVLENQKVLSQLYGVLFNLIDTSALRYVFKSHSNVMLLLPAITNADSVRPQLCHLLSLITRRRHVRPFRIQVLYGFLYF